MKKTALIPWLVFLVLLQSCSIQSFKQNLQADPSLQGFHEKVDAMVIQKMNEYNIPGLSIGLIHYDSIIYTKGYGIRSIKNNSLVTENTVFHTASISKLFTAMAIMKLVEQRKLSLEDTLTSLLPKLKYTDNRINNITIKQLLNHTSGLRDIGNYHWGNNNRFDTSLEEFVLQHHLKLDANPSSTYQYNNLGYDILGHVIEKISFSTFDDFLKDNILAPSGMDNSDFRYFKIPDSLKTSPHSKRWITKHVYERKTYPYTREHAPSSTLNSSSKDLSKWMISFMHNVNNLEDNKGYRQMISPTFKPNERIGLGFQLGSIMSQKTISHYGGDKGFRSYLLMIPEKRIGLVLLANCDYNEHFRQEIVHPIAKFLLTRYGLH
ncbi:serine hydrolase domain-containing protein [Spongiimicrobium salis]|uniref:serine hydrolase domain-containing protein n=1 Tax=Spongiimicrobium salis TaxID=1667022 RepID=UPI00374DAD8F